MPEAVWFESRDLSWLFQRGIVSGFGLGRRDIADRFQDPPMVEPVHPFQGRKLHGVEVLPWPTPMDDLGLVEAVDGLEVNPICLDHTLLRRICSGTLLA